MPFKIITFVIVFGIEASVSFAQTSLINYNLEDDIAIQGYDAVAYFNAGKAIEGKKEFGWNYQGVPYYFSSIANRDLFIKNPSNFEPQYGGWCAYAMGKSGEKVEIDPETFKIVNGKLYLFYNAYFTNTLPLWNADEKNLKTRADQNWYKFIHQ